MCILIILILAALFIYVQVTSPDFMGLRKWSKLLWQWGWKFALYLFISISVLLISYYKKENAIVLAGGIFQVAGTIWSILSLFALVKKYEETPIKNWIKEFPSWKVKILSDFIAFDQVGTAKCLNSVSVDDDNNELSIEDRVANIFLNQKKIADRLNMVYRNVDEHNDRIENIKERIKKIEHEVSQSEGKMELHLIEWHLRDFIPTFGGLVWIAAGTIISTIASLLQ